MRSSQSSGAVTVAALNLVAHVTLLYYPHPPPAGLLESTSYAYDNRRLWLSAGEGFDGLPLGANKELKPVVGRKDGQNTTAEDYIMYDSYLNPHDSGTHALSEAVNDMREVDTIWLSEAEAGPEEESILMAVPISKAPGTCQPASLTIVPTSPGLADEGHARSYSAPVL